ncbi:MAG: endo-1,4-beta-xylanase, partial [Pricia sp.]
VPQWMRDFIGDRDAWIAMMETHVSTVAGHFQTLGETVVSWDVVNEAFNDTGGYRGSSPDDTGSQGSIWYDNIGVDYIELAFRTAREADADADLYYNDYNLLFGGEKFDLAVAMINDFQARGVPIDGLGFQAHISLNAPSITQIRQTLEQAVNIEPAIKIKITELDVRVNNTNSSQVFTSEMAEAQKAYIHDVVEAYLDVVPPAQRGGITVWGIHDGDTWLIDFLGRIEWPLLFLENLEPKPALQGFADALEGN